MKLSPYQERLARLRAENGLSENEIARLLGLKCGTVRNHFVQIRELLQIPTFEEAYKKYKKAGSQQ